MGGRRAIENNPGYHAVHNWIRNIFGAPNICERCGTRNAKRFEWANKSRQYKRDISDWERLCVTCHRRDGFVYGEYGEPWNKGKHIQTNTGRTHFKKGHPPFNKKRLPRICLNCKKNFQPSSARRLYCKRRCYLLSVRADVKTK